MLGAIRRALPSKARRMAPVVGLAPTRTGLKDRALGSLHSRAEKKVLPPGLAPGLRPHLGLNGYKPFVLLYTTGGERGGTRRAETAAEVLTVAGAFGRGSPSREVRDDFFSKESRLACPVHVPYPRQELHLHSPRFEVGASAIGLRGH